MSETINERRDLSEIFYKHRMTAYDDDLDLILAIYHDEKTGYYECLSQIEETADRLVKVIVDELAKIKKERLNE